MEKTLHYLNNKFLYKSDGGFDRWTLMKENEHDKLEGDCEDYSLWVAYHLVAKSSWLKLYWMILTRKVKFHYVRVKSNWEPHMVLEYDGKFIDNWHKKWVSKEKMESVFKFKKRAILTTVWVKQIRSHLYDLFN